MSLFDIEVEVARAVPSEITRTLTDMNRRLHPIALCIVYTSSLVYGKNRDYQLQIDNSYAG